MAKNEAYKGVFANMEFPDYEYEHYPLMMTKGSGKTASEQLIVNSEAEETEAAKDGWKSPPKVGKPVTISEQEMQAKDDEIEKLKAELAAVKAPKAPAPPPAKA